MFVMFTDDKFAVRYDQITAVRQLDERDLDTRTGSLRKGIPTDAVTEVVTARGTYYTSVPFDEIVEVLTELAHQGVGDD